jgi:hypothetical protein
MAAMTAAIASAAPGTSTPATTAAICPSGLQAKIDSVFRDCDRVVYDDCNGCGTKTTWEDQRSSIKPSVEKLGYRGAAHATPALFVVLAAAANHFLN